MSTTSDFEGRTVIVTGGAAGIGAAVTERFLRAGAAVTVLDLAKETEQEGARLLTVDVSDREAVKAAVREIGDREGCIDILVNNAGIMPSTTVEKMPEGEWERVVSVNLNSAYYCSKYSIPYLRHSAAGSIVNVSSINDGFRISTRGGAHYTATKAAIAAMTRHLAYELAVDGIRVNAIAPGPTRTRMGAQGGNDVPPYIPLRQWVEPSDIADAVAFLAGPSARMITGTTLTVDGGTSLNFSGSQEDYFRLRDRS